MLKEKFKAITTEKDAATDVVYYTSRAIKLKNNNFINLISDDKKKTQKVSIAKYHSIKSVIFRAKIIFNINEVIRSVIDSFNALNNDLYVTYKIVTKIFMN